MRTGYCLVPRNITPEMHPEQGPVWQWIYDNDREVFSLFNPNYRGEGAGALRRIDDRSLEELHRIFEVSGGKELFEIIESHSERKAQEMGYEGATHQYMMDTFTKNSAEE